MKLKNFFKKNSVKNTSNKQVLSKDQLGKVIGGTDTLDTPVESPTENKRLYGPGQSHWGSAK